MWPFKKHEEKAPAKRLADRGPGGGSRPARQDREYDPLTDLTSPLNPASPLHPIWHDTDHGSRSHNHEGGCHSDHGGGHHGGGYGSHDSGGGYSGGGDSGGGCGGGGD